MINLLSPISRRIRKIYSPFRIIKTGERITHRLHDVISFLGLGIAILSFASKIHYQYPPEGFKVDWKVIVGLALFIIGLLLKQLAALELRLCASLPIALTSGVAEFKSEILFSREMKTESDLPLLAKFVDDVYPHSFISQATLEIREQVYRRWYKSDEHFARLLCKQVGNNAEEVLAGFSIIMRISRDTYTQYRNGVGAPWTWTSNDFLGPNASGTPFLFIQGFYCSRELGREGSILLTKTFIEHIRSFCRNVGSEPPVLIAPVATTQGEENAKRLGFEFSRKSQAGFKIYELDCRRVNELSFEAQEVFRLLAEAN